jgi:hypothetical protein
MFPQNLSERCGAFAVSDLVRILLNCNDLVSLRLMAPNNIPLRKSNDWALCLSARIMAVLHHA